MFDSTLLDFSKEKMKYGSARHTVIASNIANANIPMAKSKDLVPFQEYFSTSTKLPIKMTSSKHMASQNALQNYNVVFTSSDIEKKLNGNNIDLDSESTKLSLNRLEYKAALSAYSKMTRIFSEILDQR